MKQVCGYRSSDGKFFESATQCEEHEFKLQVRRISLDLESSIRNYKDHYLYGRDEPYVMLTHVEDVIREYILTQRERILSIYKFEDEHKERIEELTQSSADKKPWWRFW